MQRKVMAVPVISQSPLLVEVVARVQRITAVSAAVHLEGLLAANRVLLPLAAVRLLEVLVELVAPKLDQMAAILLVG